MEKKKEILQHELGPKNKSKKKEKRNRNKQYIASKIHWHDTLS